MTNKKTTKRALIVSVISLLLSFTMLLGTTYAWFTDSVTSTNNIIKSGNLDVELYWSTDTSDWKKVDADTNVFSNELWEPGHTEVVYLKVVNEGSLALKYQLGVNIAEELGSVNVYGKNFKLSDFIMYGTVKGKTNAFGTREDAIAKLTSAQKLNVPFASNSELYPADNTLGKASEEYITLVVYMPETVGNDANHAKDADVPTIKLGINLFATQQMAENDSFGNDYDANAILPWDSTVDTEWYDESKSEYVLYTAEELAGFSALVYGGNNMSGKTVKLGADINLGNLPWTPIGRMIHTGGKEENSTFYGNFDGQGHTVYNLNVNTVDELDDSDKGAGLFGAITGNVSNVNVVNATINTAHWAGAIAGSIQGTIENCSVENVTINCLPESINGAWDNGDKAGAIVGYASKGEIKNCTVGKTTITGYRDLGAIAGASYNSVVGSKVTGPVTIVKDSTHDYKGTSDNATVNKLVGTLYGGATVDATGEENVTITTTTLFTPESNEDLKDALTSDETYIIVDLTSDVTYQVSSWNTFAMGGENTNTIKINGNGHAITFDLRDSDWSHVTTNGAKLIINDAEIKSAGYNSGHWKRNGVAFGCELELNDVTTCPIILEQSAMLNDVTINGKDNVYGLWIAAKDMTVVADGLTVNSGRGIKIADEDAGTLGKTKLTVSDAKFNTTAKAAVLVTSTAGAEIVIGENVSLAGVKADPVNAVWVDEDREAYFGLVTVIGGNKAKESEASKITYIFTAEDLIKLSGKSVNGTYVLANNIDMEGAILDPMYVYNATNGANVTFDGNGYVISNIDLSTKHVENGMTNAGLFHVGAGNYGTNGNTLTVKDLVISKATLVGQAIPGYDCNSAGVVVGYINSDNKVTLENVDVIDSSVVNEYGNAGVLIGYCFGSVIELKDCDVINSSADCKEMENGAERDEKQGAYIATVGVNTDISVFNCTNGSAQKDFGRLMTGITGITEVADTTSFKSALNTAQDGDTIIFTGDVDYGTAQMAVDKNITLDLNGKTFSSDNAYGIISLKNGASIKNGAIDIKSNVAAIRAFNVGSIENVTIKITPKATDKVVTAIAIQNGGHVGSIKNVTIEGATQGIEVGYQAKVDVIENTTVKAVSNGTKAGNALVINGGAVGTAVGCTFDGDTYGVYMKLKGVIDVTLELDSCTVKGGTSALKAEDEVGADNGHCSTLTLTYDEETVFNGNVELVFEDEAKPAVTVNGEKLA